METEGRARFTAEVSWRSPGARPYQPAASSPPSSSPPCCPPSWPPRLPAGGGTATDPPPAPAAPTSTPAGQTNAPGLTATVYRSPACGCCENYEGYLEGAGFRVQSVSLSDPAAIKDELGIPQEMRGCHTTVLGDYYVEGHVPVEAIWKLLEERPPIDGIALPGMPLGSPGMGGAKAGPFVVYAIAGDEVTEFMSI